jgi:hypothetical protein
LTAHGSDVNAARALFEYFTTPAASKIFTAAGIA